MYSLYWYIVRVRVRPNSEIKRRGYTPIRCDLPETRRTGFGTVFVLKFALRARQFVAIGARLLVVVEVVGEEVHHQLVTSINNTSCGASHNMWTRSN